MAIRGLLSLPTLGLKGSSCRAVPERVCHVYRCVVRVRNKHVYEHASPLERGLRSFLELVRTPTSPCAVHLAVLQGRSSVQRLASGGVLGYIGDALCVLTISSLGLKG